MWGCVFIFHVIMFTTLFYLTGTTILAEAPEDSAAETTTSTTDAAADEEGAPAENKGPKTMGAF